MPPNQSMREKVAKRKLIPVDSQIAGKKLLFCDDSIVRGTQLKETVDFLHEHGAKEVHMRRSYLTPEFELLQIGTEDVLSVSNTITDINGDHMQSWWDE